MALPHMQPQLVPDDSASKKRDNWLAIGKRRVRIPADIHADLIAFQISRRYRHAFDALLFCASEGLKYLNNKDRVNEINVEKGDA